MALWAELIRSAIYILNRTRKTSVECKSLHELWFGKKPRINHLRIIGSECYAHVPNQKRKKRDSKAIKGYLIGYDSEERYRIYIKESQRIVLSRDVQFNEKVIDCENEKDKDTISQIEYEKVTLLFNSYEPNVIQREETDHPITERNGQHPTSNNETSAGTTESEGELFEECSQDTSMSSFRGFEASERLNSNNNEPIRERLRDRTKIHHNSRYDDFVMESQHFVCQIETPTTYQDTLNSPENSNWMKAM
ncbi:uncharacterized protein LOC142226152 [Haematobia irritans]|uniref:uncharacterized protein LOC142226152 n=1 Tax=Haematobia irritans TaxID=7368 RepID=UPI003F4F52D9